MKILIVDDEPHARENLCRMLRDAGYDQLEEASSVDSAADKIGSFHPDLLLLDIQLGGKNAFQLIERFPDHPCHIIFVTAYDQYAIRAIKCSASDYILKPVNRDELLQSVGKVKKGEASGEMKTLIENLAHPHPKKLAIADTEGVSFIEVSQVLRCESDGNYTNFYLLTGRRMMASKAIGEFEELLSGQFLRIHRSHLINLDHVKRYIRGEGGYVELIDGSRVEVSRRRKNQLMEKLQLG